MPVQDCEIDAARIERILAITREYFGSEAVCASGNESGDRKCECLPGVCDRTGSNGIDVAVSRASSMRPRRCAAQRAP